MMMQRGLLVAFAVGLATQFAVAQETPAAPAEPAAPVMLKGSASLASNQGASMGKVTFQDGTSGVLIKIESTGLTPGWHGTHFHEKGDCSDASDGFKASGSHTGHGSGVEHGLLNPKGPESGDLPNIYAAADGTANAELFVSGMKLVDMVDADGTALIIHANADDHMSQPIGGAGDRVACGVVTKSE